MSRPIGAVSCFAALAAASKDSWEELGAPTCRRLNLGLVTAGVASALWVDFAPHLTQLPGTTPLASHQAYSGLQRAALIGSFGSAAALSAAVWARSLPEEVRGNPLAWPGRIADGVAKSLVSLAPKSADDPVSVKYALLCSSFLLFTAVPILASPSFPLSVIPSWTGRRLSRAFPAWTFLAAVSTYNLKEAAENGKLLADSTCRTLSKGINGFGAVYLSAKVRTTHTRRTTHGARTHGTRHTRDTAHGTRHTAHGTCSTCSTCTAPARRTHMHATCRCTSHARRTHMHTRMAMHRWVPYSSTRRSRRHTTRSSWCPDPPPPRSLWWA